MSFEHETRLMRPRAVLPRLCGAVGVEGGLSGAVFGHGACPVHLNPPQIPHSLAFAIDTPRRTPAVPLRWAERLSWGGAPWIR